MESKELIRALNLLRSLDISKEKAANIELEMKNIFAELETDNLLSKEIINQKNVELKNMQLLLRSSLESPKDMIILAIDKDYNYLYFNDAHKKSMKFAYNKDVNIKMNLLECITSNVDKENAKTNYDLALTGVSHSTIQEYGDKEISYYETLYNPIHNDKNEIIGPTAFARDISGRMNALNKLKESEEKYRLLYSNMSQGLAWHEIITDDSGRPIDYIYLDINDSYEEFLHVKREDIIGKRITEVMPKVEPYWIEVFGKVALTGEPMEYENYLETTGKYYNTYTYRTSPGKFAVLVTDITERIKTLNLLKESEKRLDMFFQQALTGFFIMMIDEPVYWNDTVDKEKVLDYIFDHQRCTRVNQAMLDQYNMNLDDFLHKTPREMFAHNIKEGKDAWRKMLDYKLIHTITDERKSDGTQMFIEGDYICMYDSLGRVIGHFGNQEDVTKRIQKQKEIEYLSNHDYLTDLYNRRYYFEQFKNLDNERLYPLGVMMIDVNGLKIINDAFGHAVGDIALKTIGKVLKNTFEPKHIVSRIGGDEFAVLVPKASLEELQQYKDRLKDAVKKQKIENIEMSLAIGYEVKTNQDEDVDDLLKLAENHMYRHKSTEGSSVRNRAISAILETLTDKYDVEREHSQKVSYYCKMIGQHLKLRTDELKELEQAGMFHDIGKISIPDSILNKPGKLTNEEYEIIKTHAEVGYQILRAADEYSDLAIHALHHHERWDGKGYPSGLKGKDIPLFSRIICVVDAYEAMTADRPYRKKLSEEYAISEIKRCSGTQFDPRIAKIFIEKVLKSEKIN